MEKIIYLDGIFETMVGQVREQYGENNGDG